MYENLRESADRMAIECIVATVQRDDARAEADEFRTALQEISDRYDNLTGGFNAAKLARKVLTCR